MAGIVVVGLLAVSIDEVADAVADADGATVQILKDPLRHKEAETVIRGIAVVPTEGAAKATVLLQKEANEIRAERAQKGSEGIGQEVTAVAKGQNNRHSSFRKDNIRYCATRLIPSSTINIRAVISKSIELNLMDEVIAVNFHPHACCRL